MTAERRIRDGLEPLFKEARDKKLWFRGVFQPVWFSPKELRSEQQYGRFIWDASHWELCKPDIRVRDLELQLKDKERELREFKLRVAREAL